MNAGAGAGGRFAPVRHLRVHDKLHHIGVGRIHTGTHVIMLVHELHVRVVQAATARYSGTSR